MHCKCVATVLQHIVTLYSRLRAQCVFTWYESSNTIMGLQVAWRTHPAHIHLYRYMYMVIHGWMSMRQLVSIFIHHKYTLILLYIYMLYVIYILSIVWTGYFVCRNANTKSQWFTLGTTNAFLSHQKNCSSGQRIFQCQKILNKRWQNHHLRGIDNWSYVRIRPRTNIYTKLLPPMFGNDLRMKWSNVEWNLIHGAWLMLTWYGKNS